MHAQNVVHNGPAAAAPVRAGEIPFHDLKTQYKALRDSIDARIRRVLEHGQYIIGPEVKELEVKLATLQCAIVLAKLERFESEVDRRLAVGGRYSELIDQLGITRIQVGPDRTTVYAQYIHGCRRQPGQDRGGSEKRRSADRRSLPRSAEPSTCVQGLVRRRPRRNLSRCRSE